MEIDLNKVIGYSKDCLRSRALMRAVILDLYPEATREMNVLLTVYESGVPDKIRRDGKITDGQYEQYVRSIIDEYSLQEAPAIEALNAWIVLWLGEDALKNIHYQKKYSVGPLPESGRVSATRFPHEQINIFDFAFGYIGDKSEYELSETDHGYEIKKYLGIEQENFVIPNIVDSKHIVGIGERAFERCKGIKRLTISEGIEYIDYGAFSGCRNLQSLLFPSTLQRISETFEYTAIREVEFPNGLSSIESFAFYGCEQLQVIWLPDQLTLIGNCAFAHCSSLKEIKLPSSTKTIGTSAFWGCSSLNSVSLNEGLKDIASSAFHNCLMLDKVLIPSTVTHIGDEAFIKDHYGTPPTVTLQCYPESPAIEYARSNGLGLERAQISNGNTKSR